MSTALNNIADMVELVDTPGLEPGVHYGRGGSTPSIGTQRGTVMSSFRVNVAIGFMDRTWTDVSTTVEGVSEEEARSIAEDKVRKEFSAHRTKAISFVKAMYIELMPL